MILKEFFNANGFINHIKVRSGDDDLFVQEAGTGKNTAVVFQREAQTLSIPKKSFKEWIRQKQRHYKTAGHYKPSHKFILGLYGALQPLFYISLLVALVFTPFWKSIVIVVGAKLLLQYLVFVFSTLKLGSYRILFALPFLEIVTWCFQVYAITLSRVNKKQRW